MKDYERHARLRHKEVFVPLAHPPSDAQADFGATGLAEHHFHILEMNGESYRLTQRQQTEAGGRTGKVGR